jgi:hypothetical protein
MQDAIEAPGELNCSMISTSLKNVTDVDDLVLF